MVETVGACDVSRFLHRTRRQDCRPAQHDAAIAVPAFFDRYWDVRCEPGSWMTGPAMIVDIQTYTVLPPQYGIPEWEVSYGAMIGEGQKLANCPVSAGTLIRQTG